MSGGGISFGAVPDMLMGKDPKDAILDNMKMAAIIGTGMAAAPAAAGPSIMGSAGTAGGAAASGGIEAMQAFNPITNAWQNPVSGGSLLSSMKAAAPTAQAAMQGIQTAQSLMPQQQPIQAAPLQGGSFDASGLLSANNQQLEALKQKRLQRRGGV